LLKAKYRDLFPNDPNMRINQNVGQIHRFVDELKVGNLRI
jgi:predicted Mrr-cat superfamily restriction endonuclease